MKKQAHVIVSGVVQGVGFRFFTRRTALRYNVSGWVKNLASGEVEIIAEGEESRIRMMLQELRTGNPHASVRNMNVDWQKYSGGFSTFDIRY